MLAAADDEPPLEPSAETDEDQATLEFPKGRLVPGRILGDRYQILTLLGRGGMGSVWRAFDLKLRVDVALKSLHLAALAGERGRNMLRQEVRTARDVMSPNVCRVFDLVEVEGEELISMEYIDGTTLSDILDARGPLELTEAREIALQFLAGLDAIHAADLVHRDVKPDNVMVTRSGRVVLMDFGIAKGLADEVGGAVVGTPAYMSPEQLAGLSVDRAADVYAAGVVLAEMIAAPGTRDSSSPECIWKRVRESPPQLAESPWRPVLLKAVSNRPEDRHRSASALSRAIEEVTLRVAGAEDVHPYPGLASFTDADAEYFFGREMEVETMWNKLGRPRLLGLIGPSGAGKSSFLRAGLLPAIPPDWRAVIAAPGQRPMTALAQVLAPEVAGDADAVRDLPRFDEIDVAVSLVARWRRRFAHALIIVDQFEELFTQNPPEVQSRFCELLGRLALEANAHVLLSMRDDFLFRCHDHPSLRPILSEMTLLGPPTGAALRRAVVEPALKCGYRFEDEALADEILAEVEHERGALPMLAFATARLWDRRDRENGLLTRAAYQEIGGVAGALAQHAEKTLEQIGNDRIPMVREIFRNLVTAHGTRVACERSELLSIFEEGVERERAAEVLGALVDARLLTSYEVEPADEHDAAHHRVEIVHESLLTNWPRLVRWQAQDEEGALLRDQLRQAAQMWQERGHPEDLLWTGTSFREYQLWRERYAGGLSTAEEEFAQAMKAKAERRKRRQRLAVAALIAFLLVVAGTIAGFWRRSESARKAAVTAEKQAEAETRHAEADTLFALARLLPEDQIASYVAYATASLERADNQELRTALLRVLWRGPAEMRLATPDSTFCGEDLCFGGLDFSPDGKWLATAADRGVRIWPSGGGAPIAIPNSGPAGNVRFSPGSDLVAFSRSLDSPSPDWKTKWNGLTIWSLTTGGVVRSIQLDHETIRNFEFSSDGARLYVAMSDAPHGTDFEIKAWSFATGDPEILGSIEISHRNDVPPGLSQTRVAWGNGPSAFVAPLGRVPVGRAAAVAIPHEQRVAWTHLSERGNLLATVDVVLTPRVWSLDSSKPRFVRTLDGTDEFLYLRFDDAGTRVASTGNHLWDLAGPPDAAHDRFAIAAVADDPGPGLEIAMSRDGAWFAATNSTSVSFWPIGWPRPRILREHEGAVADVAFTPDGRWLVSSGRDDGTLRLWPLDGSSGERARVIHRLRPTRNELRGSNAFKVAPVFSEGKVSAEWPRALAVSPDGTFVAFASNKGRVGIVSLPDRSVRELERASDEAWSVSIDPSGRFVAAGTGKKAVPVWDLETGKVRILDPACTLSDALCGKVRALSVRFTASGDLLVGSDEIRRWDVRGDTPRLLESRPFPSGPGALPGVDFDPNGRRALLVETGGQKWRSGALWIEDLETGSARPLPSRGDETLAATFDSTGEVVVSAAPGGIVRVGPADTETPHMLAGDEAMLLRVRVSPDARWIATASLDGTIRLWPMPDLSRRPLHTLPREELVRRLRKLTNIRAVPDPGSATGWKLEPGPFPGWDAVPTW